MSRSVKSKVTKVECVKPATDAEIDAIYEAFDEVIMPSPGKIHPLEGGQPICSDAQGGMADDVSTPKPIKSVPKGYRPFCKYCLAEWRWRQND